MPGKQVAKNDDESVRLHFGSQGRYDFKLMQKINERIIHQYRNQEYDCS